MELWIARDSYGLWLYNKKPYQKFILNNDKCFKYEGRKFLIDDALFPEVTFENSPQKVRIELIKE